jgi:uncharacterized protein YdhG (YjbR/CyaY superfamily)
MSTKPETEYKNIDDYIDSQSPLAQTFLKQLQNLIKKTAPEAIETISYQMPAFKLHGLLVWFAAAKNHYALYPKAEVIEAFKDKLKPYGLSKGTIRFSYEKPLPESLITEIIEYRVKENLGKELAKKSARKKPAIEQ